MKNGAAINDIIIIARLMTTGLIYGLLYVLSMWFDEFVDRRLSGQVEDGTVAELVGYGTLYTIAGWFLVGTVWFGWRNAGLGALLLLFAFVFSGLPMWNGEKARNRRERERKANSRPERRSQYQRGTW